MPITARHDQSTSSREKDLLMPSPTNITRAINAQAQEIERLRAKVVRYTKRQARYRQVIAELVAELKENELFFRKEGKTAISLE